MPVLNCPVPTKSRNAWEVIGGVHNMLVQRRTEQGLESNQRLYHKILYKSTDHFAFRIIYSEDPADFADAALSVGPAIQQLQQPVKKTLFSRKPKLRRVVVAIGASRDEILLDWDLIKQALADVGTRNICPAEPSDWSTVYLAATAIVRRQGCDATESIYQSTARFTDAAPEPEAEESEDEQEAGSTGNVLPPPAPAVVAPPQRLSGRVKGVAAVLCAVGALVTTVLACLLVCGILIVPRAIAAANGGLRLVQAAQVDVTVFLVLFVTVRALQPHIYFAPSTEGALSGNAAQPQGPTRTRAPSKFFAAQPTDDTPAAAGNASLARGPAGAATASPAAAAANRPPYAVETYRKYPLQITVDGCDGVYLPNEAPFPVQTPHFTGLVYAKVLTTPPDPKLAPYFAGKRRKFEIQMQGTFTVPAAHRNADGTVKGIICFAAYLPNQLHVGFLLRSFWKVIVAVFTRLTRGSAITLGSECPGAKPAFTGIATNSLDALIETPPGQAPPPLGIPMLPDTGDLQRMRAEEKRTNVCPFKLDGYTYSCSFHSQNADFVTWTLTNVPGVPQIDFCRMWGDNPLRVGFYLLPPGVEQRFAITKGVTLLELQMTNAKLSSYIKF